MASAQDRVYYHDHSVKPERVSTLEGTITAESVAGIKIKPTVGAEREVPAGDIVDIQYNSPGAVKIRYSSAFQTDQKRTSTDTGLKALVDVQKEYEWVLSQLKDDKTAAMQRHLKYRLAVLRLNLAKDKVQVLEAADLLDKFRKDYPNSWQVVPCSRQLAQVRLEADQYAEAVKVYDELAKQPGIPKDVKQEFELNAIDVLMRAKDYASAEKRIDEALRKLPAADVQAARLKVLQVGCQASKVDLQKVAPMLRDTIEKTADPGLKALAYNTLGDCYNAKGQKKDAMWAWLWVDVVYNQDKSEHIKALERLSQVFKDLNDDDHAAKYKEKLTRMR
jgi:tetratricopeptide (TPR) repeat protein